MVGVQEWAEVRRLALVEGLSIREIARRTGRHRATVRAALRSAEPPRYVRSSTVSKLDPFKDEVHRLLQADGRMPSQRIRELLAEQGYRGGKTITDAYVREVRPLFCPPRTHQRTVYRPGELLQLDLWQPAREIPVGYGQTRAGYVVVAALGFSRLGAGALVFSKEAPDVLWGIWRCLSTIGVLPRFLVCDREGCLHAGGGRPSDAFAAFCGRLAVAPWILEPSDCQAKGVVERLQGFLETSFEPGRVFCNEFDFQHQLDGWFAERANVRLHRALRARPVDRFGQERAVMRPLPAVAPELDRRFVVRVAPQPYVRVDRNDYSLDPRLAGRRVEVRVSQRQVSAVALDSGQPAAQHRRLFAAHQVLTAPAHQDALDALRRERSARTHARRGEVDVEIRSLERYDELIPA